MVDIRPILDVADRWIVDRPGNVIVAFLLVTAVFALGLGSVSTESGTEQFAEDVPASEALDEVTESFEDPFAADEGSTQLIQRGENVLSKRGLVRMLELQSRLADDASQRVTSTESAASIVALTLDPEATTLDAQRDAVEDASPREIRQAVRTAAAENPGFTVLLSTDFNARDASASATIGIVRHAVPAGLEDGAGSGGASPLSPIQREGNLVAESVGGDVVVFGSGTIADEFATVIGDSLLIVVPAAVVLIVVFLVVAYRDLVDLLLGIAALGMAIVWTLGFMGVAGIAFSQILIAVPPLLLAVGIDYGIHSINRYREERQTGADKDTSMRRTTDQLQVAFFIVTSTTVIGFSSNLSSDLIPIREFGVVASIGIVFTFLIFGVYLPASKLYVDRLRDRYPIPTFSQEPIGATGSLLGRALSGGVVVARVAPAAFVVTVLLASAGAGAYASGIDTTFSDEDFLPPADVDDAYYELPEPFRPGRYSITATINYLEDTFEASEGDEVVLYVEGPMERDNALESLYRAGENPPDTFVRQGTHAREESIVTVIRAQAARDPDFAAVVRENDVDRNGIPDRNLDVVYDALFASSARDRALEYLTEDRRSARVVYAVEGDAAQREVTDDARRVADRFRMHATATGNIVVFQAISELIFESALVSLALSIAGTSVFLVFIYWVLEGRASLGLANVVPIVVTVSFLAGTMRAVGFSLNAFTATVLAITIGLGIDYSVHVVHRFVDEFHEQQDLVPALERTVYGTGGALFGSVLTTAFGIGVLTLSVFPAIGQFGVLTALSVVYAFLSSLFVLPPTLALWVRIFGGDVSDGETGSGGTAGSGATDQ